MAFFKFRKTPDDGGSAPIQPPSVESIRQRAKYRLAGATVLVLLGVIGFPLLFDKQPRPIAVDTPISIPDKDKVLPLAVPIEPASAPVAPAVNAAPDKATSAAVSASSEVVITEAAEPEKLDGKASGVQVKSQSAASAPPVPAIKEQGKPAKSVSNTDATKQAEAARVQSLLDGQVAVARPAEMKTAEPTAAAGDGRFVVQVGSFAEDVRAREVRVKLERAGLKTYTQVADTKDGKRIRVRVGPFATKAEAVKAAEKIKKLNLPVALLSL